MITYKLFWDEFSGWYLEIIKPEYQKPIDRVTYDATISLFEKLAEGDPPFHAIYYRGDMAASY